MKEKNKKHKRGKNEGRIEQEGRKREQKEVKYKETGGRKVGHKQGKNKGE